MTDTAPNFGDGVNGGGEAPDFEVQRLKLSDAERIAIVRLDGAPLGSLREALATAPVAEDPAGSLSERLAESSKSTPFGSSIINISSIMGLVGYSETSAYNAGKGAVRLFTKAVAIEFARKRTPIRVNSIHPGFVRTPLLEIGMCKWVALGFAEKAQDLIDGLAAATPNGRLAEPAEIAGVAYFLACDDSSYCTGSELVVDGGWTAQ